MNKPVSVPLQWLEHGLGLDEPVYHSVQAAGMDLQAAVDADHPQVIAPGQRALIPCGFQMALPTGFEAQVRPRSGLAIKKGLTVLNAPGTIDADYRGELKVILINHGTEPVSVERGMRVAQLVIQPVSRARWEVTESLEATDRGAGGFGHTGH
ncbi:MAG: dUTP diphosphatase [Phycisphaeraceae bacterium]|nr:dUTP diphosphatase [Phycisphaeraceae bacterium]